MHVHSHRSGLCFTYSTVFFWGFNWVRMDISLFRSCVTCTLTNHVLNRWSRKHCTFFFHKNISFLRSHKQLKHSLSSKWLLVHLHTWDLVRCQSNRTTRHEEVCLPHHDWLPGNQRQSGTGFCVDSAQWRALLLGQQYQWAHTIPASTVDNLKTHNFSYSITASSRQLRKSY